MSRSDSNLLKHSLFTRKTEFIFSQKMPEGITIKRFFILDYHHIIFRWLFISQKQTFYSFTRDIDSFCIGGRESWLVLKVLVWDLQSIKDFKNFFFHTFLVNNIFCDYTKITKKEKSYADFSSQASLTSSVSIFFFSKSNAYKKFWWVKS